MKSAKLQGSQFGLLNKIGKCYTFQFTSGWLGGQGVVFAKTINKAVELANEAIAKEPHSAVNHPSLTKDDLKEVKMGTCEITNNGDY